jgi:GT2 family glycosyltransferase
MPSDVTVGPSTGPAPGVTAVVVAHDGARWLPALRAALEAQTRPPDAVTAADTGSSDETPQLLASWLGADRVVSLDPDTGFGDAVRAALPAGGPAGRWVWLLHDDCAPDPDALARLLAEVGRNPATAVAGPKLRAWHDRRMMLEVGVTISRSGRRETMLDRREQDQGQHDGNRAVLAVSTAGMLVRRDVWDELGGLDPALPLLRDDVDLGWRANLAGHRVAVVTDAVVHHAEAAARRRRPARAGGHRLHRLDRQHAAYVLLANLPLPLVPVAVVSLVLGGLLRALGYLAGKRPRESADELAALAAVLARPVRLVRARRARRGTRRVPSRTALPLLAPRSAGLRNLHETANVLTAGPLDRRERARHRAATARRATSAPATGPTAEEAEDLPSWGGGLVRRLVRHPSLFLAVGLAVLALVATRGLVGDGRLLGGALLPAPDAPGDLWRAYVSAWHPVGVGSDTVAPPYLGVLAGLATVLLGAGRAVDLLLLGCVPLAGLSAYAAARPLVRSVPLRLWGAVTYALLPAVLGSVSAGRLGTAVVAVLLPLAGLAVARGLGGLGAARGTGSSRATWTAALLLAVMTAFVPLTALVVLVLAGVAGTVLRGRDLVRLLVLVVVPPVLLLPWLPAVVSDPALLLLESGLPGPGLSEPDLSAVDVLLLRPGGPGMPPVLLTAALLLVALGALLRPDRRRPVAAGWVLALTGLTVAVVVSRLDVTAPTLRTPVPAWPGAATLLAGAGLLLAAVTGAEGARRRVAGSSFGWRQPSAVLLVVAAAVAPVLLAGWWAVGGADGPLQRRDPVLLPAFVAAEGDQPNRPRTLVIRSLDDGGLSYALLRSEGPRLGDAELSPPTDAGTGLDRVVADLASGRGGDAAARLVPYGVRYVLMSRPLDRALARGVDAVPGVTRVSGPAGAILWRIDYPTARLRVLPPGAPVVGSDGSPPAARILPAGQVLASATVREGPAGRLAVLADPRDDGWRARLDGRALPPRTYGGWAQAFELPATGGRLEVTHDQGGRTLLLWLQLAAAALVLLLALPKARTRVDDLEDDVEAADAHPHRSRTGAVR